jgi:hypothetical protein
VDFLAEAVFNSPAKRALCSALGGSSQVTEWLPPKLPAINKGLVAREGIEPPTRGFSVRCSTN